MPIGKWRKFYSKSINKHYLDVCNLRKVSFFDNTENINICKPNFKYRQNYRIVSDRIWLIALCCWYLPAASFFISANLFLLIKSFVLLMYSYFLINIMLLPLSAFMCSTLFSLSFLFNPCSSFSFRFYRIVIFVFYLWLFNYHNCSCCSIFELNITVHFKSVNCYFCFYLQLMKNVKKKGRVWHLPDSCL